MSFTRKYSDWCLSAGAQFEDDLGETLVLGVEIEKGLREKWEYS